MPALGLVVHACGKDAGSRIRTFIVRSRGLRSTWVSIAPVTLSHLLSGGGQNNAYTTEEDTCHMNRTFSKYSSMFSRPDASLWWVSLATCQQRHAGWHSRRGSGAARIGQNRQGLARVYCRQCCPPCLGLNGFLRRTVERSDAEVRPMLLPVRLTCCAGHSSEFMWRRCGDVSHSRV